MASHKRVKRRQCVWCEEDLTGGVQGQDFEFCACCSETKEDAFCLTHLDECECGTLGCPGCWTVNKCSDCHENFCRHCMGEGACCECGNLYWCEECLEAGRCPKCAWEWKRLRGCREACVALMKLRDHSLFVRNCVPREVMQNIGRAVWATRNDAEVWHAS